MKSIFIPVAITLLSTTTFVRGQNKPNGVTTPAAATPDTLPRSFDNTTAVSLERIYTPVKPITSPVAITMQSSVNDVRIATTYTDGMGRPLQTILNKLSPGQKDLVYMNTYDAMGRESQKFLPYAASGDDGLFKQNVYQEAKQANETLFPGEQVHYGKSYYDRSPLEMVMKATAPGNSWEGSQRGTFITQRTNTVADSVRRWAITSPDISAIPISSGIYGADQLLVQTETNEQNQVTVKYIDQKGRVILFRRKVTATAGPGHIGWQSTYMIYDEVNNLRFTISPKAVVQIMGNWLLDSDTLRNELCFQYQLDDKKRIVAMVTPGAGLTEMVYDSRGRIVYSRKANLKDKGWQVNYYDGLDRQIKTGFYNQAKTRAQLQQAMDDLGGSALQENKVLSQTDDMTVSSRDISINTYKAGKSITFVDGFETSPGDNMDAFIDPESTNGTYSDIVVKNPAPPEDNVEWLSYAFYDDYSWSGASSFQGSYTSRLTDGGNPNADMDFNAAAVRGKMTGTKTRVLGTDQWLTTTVYYNARGRAIQTIADNVTGGKDISTNLYDFNGKMLSNYLAHSNPRSVLTPTTSMLSVVKYDHAGRIMEIRKRPNDNAAMERVIVQQEYNSMGMLRKKTLGIQSDGSTLDSLVYDYNIRGWLTGINKNYVNTDNSGMNKFGEILSYDIGFDVPQYGGNIAGIRWKGWNDKVARAYGYTYDNLNQLVNADFNQQNTPGAAWTKDKADFTVSGLEYDPNGNITAMSQLGLKGNTIAPVDKLTYSYTATSNKLQGVIDAANDVNSALGDFKDANGTNPIDYDYDASGNMTKDLNKNITSITYNILNRPELITVAGKGTVRYFYDASGQKVRKTVTDNSKSVPVITTTDYAGGIIYKNDSLQFIGNEEGRIRAIYKSGTPVSLVYDYFERDHQGNVRIVMTEQTDVQLYAATMETSAAPVENALFSNIDASRVAKPAGYPEDNTTAKNAFVARLNGRSGGQKVGPSLVLKVTAGDTVQIMTKAFYKSGGPQQQKAGAMPEEMLTALVNNFNGPGGTPDIHTGTESSNSPFGSKFTSKDYERLVNEAPGKDPDAANRPRAYLNYVLFDDQFNMVDANSGVKQVKEEADQLQTLGTDKMPITKSGFLYVYTSNESQQDVYFDNLMLGVSLGPVIEETHYYPFGVQMAGISSDASSPALKNSFRYDGGAEWESELDVNQYSTFYRKYDPQIGRFLGVDILAGSVSDFSPYNYALNNPVLLNDPLGDEVTVRQIIDNMLDNPGFSHGGSWTPTGGYEAFGNETTEFTQGAMLISQFNLWGSYGFASNYTQAAIGFNQGQADKGSNERVSTSVYFLAGIKVVLGNNASYYVAGIQVGWEMSKAMTMININQMLMVQGWANTAGGWGQNGAYTAETFLGSSGGDKANKVAGSTATALGIQESMMKLAATTSGLEEAEFFGKRGFPMYKGLGFVGRGAFVLQLGVSVVQIRQQLKRTDVDATTGDKTWHISKAALDAAVCAATIWGGPVGIGIGAVYFVVDQAGGFNWAHDKIMGKH
ncbi:DUF6443 domain-containing protein [Chitinophaga flava]|nr:DUF6443 domain-containing protein [Chitinophaga flava]